VADAGLTLSPKSVTALSHDRVGWAALGAGCTAYFVLSAWLTSDTTFNADELAFFSDDRGFEVENLLTPHNGHLMALTRVIYAASFSTFGVDYTPLRLLGFVSGIVTAMLLFALIKHRIGPAAAATLSLVVLFTAPDVTLFPVGMHILQAVAAGLGAFLALERRRIGWDVAACALLTLAVLTFSTGVAFVAGAAVWVLLGEDRWRRAWVFLVPAALYGGWWLWAQQFEEGLGVTALNALLAPNYAAESSAAALASLAGLDYDFTGAGSGGPVVAEWGRPLAVVAGIALVLRALRIGASRSLLGFLAIAAALWLAGALAFGPLREPTAGRYVYAVAVVVVLVGAEAVRGVRVSRAALVAMILVALASLSTSLVQLRDAGARFRFISDRVRAELAILELEADYLDPRFEGGLGLPITAEGYLRSVERYGSFAYSIADVQAQSGEVRAAADELLAQIAAPRLERVRGEPRLAGCRELRAAPGRPLMFEVPRQGVVLRPDQPTSLALRRFAATFEIGPFELPANEFTALRPLADDAGRAWSAAASGTSTAMVCPAVLPVPDP
jgi:hypothetical protein